MIDWTTTHFRYLMRLIASNALLYTEMQTPGAIMHHPHRALLYDAKEKPIALQLGGSDPKALAECAKLAEDLGFDEINFNLGCPSSRVQTGRFGACMMAEPDLAANCISAMKKAVTIPVTVKTRIGIDQQDSYAFFKNFVQQLINAGCDKLIVHARKAWLTGLNPKQNRTIPPLHYDFAYHIKQEFTAIPVIINGNITTVDEIKQHMQLVDGVMIGRLACNNPYALSSIHQHFYPDVSIKPRSEIMQDYFDYAAKQAAQNIPLTLLLKPAFNIMHGLAGAKLWKQQLLAAQQTKQVQLLQNALHILVDNEKSFVM